MTLSFPLGFFPGVQLLTCIDPQLLMSYYPLHVNVGADVAQFEPEN